MKIEASSLKNIKEYDNHKVVYFLNKASGLYGIVAIHSMGTKGLSCFGATRFWSYTSYHDALKDVLRLSKTMSYKSIMAGLPYGGAKGVIIASPENIKNKKFVLLTYANQIKGKKNFITGADVGLKMEDLQIMRQANKNIVGFKGDAVMFTSLGIYHSIKTCLENVFGTENITSRSFVIQGLGSVGMTLVKMLYGQAKHITATDIDPEKIRIAKAIFPDIEIVSPDEILNTPGDVFCPCAMGNVLNNKNIETLKCRIIVGGANNQLENKEIGDRLFQKGILYAPDYVVNAGGLISVTDEYEHEEFSHDRIRRKVENIRNTLTDILDTSTKNHKATNLVADEIAEQRFKEQGWLEESTAKIACDKIINQ
ncbi:Glu/Leu/Phe/Val dehydrogenase dimerization domain-containing protein [Candidatus Margulisiibacteriota bacterium]